MSKYIKTFTFLIALVFLIPLMYGCAIPKAFTPSEPKPFEMKFWGEPTGIMLPGCLPEILRQDIGPFLVQAVPAFDWKAAFIELNVQEGTKRMCSIAIYGTGACWKLMAVNSYCFDADTGKNEVSRYWAYEPNGEFSEVTQEVYGELVKNIDLEYIYQFCPEKVVSDDT